MCHDDIMIRMKDYWDLSVKLLYNVHNSAGFTMYLCDIFITVCQNKTT